MRLNLTGAGLLALALTACGGGGGGGSATGSAANSENALATCSPTMADPLACTPALTLALVDEAGTPLTAVTPARPGVLLARIALRNGTPVPNATVTFSTTDTAPVFNPSAGTAVTDAQGIARLGLSAGATAGSYRIDASASARMSLLTASMAYAVSYPTLTLSELQVAPRSISAGGTASVSLSLMNGSVPYTVPTLINLTSTCVSAGKATLDSPVLTSNGAATATYVDKGCGVRNDPIRATVAYNGGLTATQTTTLDVLPPTAGSLRFVAADTTNIALKGTGGMGRQEVSRLSFDVLDNSGLPARNTLVDFVFANSNSTTTTGGLTLNAASATSDANGRVNTQVVAGTQPASVRVLASVRGTSVQTLSNVLTVSTGLPTQSHFSIASSTGNCEGQDFNQVCSTITATLADHFGNPVADGTTVNFIAEGGSIDASCVTGSLPGASPTPLNQTTNVKVGPGSGTCSVVLRSALPRPSDGRVTILAYALGEEDFFDANGNNLCDDCANTTGLEFKPEHDRKDAVFRDDDESGAWDQGEACISLAGVTNCAAQSDGRYNGVLDASGASGAKTTYISRQLVQVFSGSHAVITPTQPALSCPANGAASVQFTVADARGNLMPAGTTVALSVLLGAGGGTVSPGSFTVPSVVLGVKDVVALPAYTATIPCPGITGANNTVTAPSGSLLVRVTTPNGVVTEKTIAIN